MKRLNTKTQPLVLFSVLLSSFAVLAQGADVPVVAAAPDQIETICKPTTLSDKACAAVLNSVREAIKNGGGADNAGELHDILSNSFREYVIKSPEVLQALLIDSGYVIALSDTSPLSLQFKMVEREEEDSVVGLEFAYRKELKRTYLTGSDKWNKYYSWDVKVNGTVTQNSEENPRNFIEAKVGFLGGFYTSLPLQPQSIIDASNGLLNCVGKPGCATAFGALVDGQLAIAQIKGFSYFKFGANAGYETDQRFDAQNKTLSAFGYASYEAWDSNSFVGSLGIRPSLYISLDEVDPNSETPRALIGDSSSFSRVSASFSVNVPIGTLLSQSTTLGFNYRIYKELSASNLVKDAGLDTFHLRTWTLRGPSGLFVSYSSGSLPFDLGSEELVELGWQTYF